MTIYSKWQRAVIIPHHFRLISGKTRAFMSDSTAILEVKDLVKTYDNGVTAVKGVTFSVRKGEVFGILGPNGAGKTTTLEMIEGLRSITSGSVVLDGIKTEERPYEVKQRIGIQLQSSSF